MSGLPTEFQTMQSPIALGGIGSGPRTPLRKARFVRAVPKKRNKHSSGLTADDLRRGVAAGRGDTPDDSHRGTDDEHEDSDSAHSDTSDLFAEQDATETKFNNVLNQATQLAMRSKQYSQHTRLRVAHKKAIAMHARADSDADSVNASPTAAQSRAETARRAREKQAARNAMYARLAKGAKGSKHGPGKYVPSPPSSRASSRSKSRSRSRSPAPRSPTHAQRSPTNVQRSPTNLQRAGGGATGTTGVGGGPRGRLARSPPPAPSPGMMKSRRGRSTRDITGDSGADVSPDAGTSGGPRVTQAGGIEISGPSKGLGNLGNSGRLLKRRRSSLVINPGMEDVEALPDIALAQRTSKIKVKQMSVWQKTMGKDGSGIGVRNQLRKNRSLTKAARKASPAGRAMLQSVTAEDREAARERMRLAAEAEEKEKAARAEAKASAAAKAVDEAAAAASAEADGSASQYSGSAASSVAGSSAASAKTGGDGGSGVSTPGANAGSAKGDAKALLSGAVSKLKDKRHQQIWKVDEKKKALTNRFSSRRLRGSSRSVKDSGPSPRTAKRLEHEAQQEMLRKFMDNEEVKVMMERLSHENFIVRTGKDSRNIDLTSLGGVYRPPSEGAMKKAAAKAQDEAEAAKEAEDDVNQAWGNMMGGGKRAETPADVRAKRRKKAEDDRRRAIAAGLDGDLSSSSDEDDDAFEERLEQEGLNEKEKEKRRKLRKKDLKKKKKRRQREREARGEGKDGPGADGDDWYNPDQQYDASKIEFYKKFRSQAHKKDFDEPETPRSAALLAEYESMLPPEPMAIVRRNSKTLNLSGFHMGDHYARAVAEGIQLSGEMYHLNLRSNRLTGAGAARMLSGIQYNKLVFLDLANNRIGMDGVMALASSAQTPAIKHLNLEGNKLGDDALIELMPFLRKCVKLTRLILRHNNIGNDGLAALSNLIEYQAGIDQMDKLMGGSKAAGGQKRGSGRKASAISSGGGSHGRTGLTSAGSTGTDSLLNGGDSSINSSRPGSQSGFNPLKALSGLDFFAGGGDPSPKQSALSPGGTGTQAGNGGEPTAATSTGKAGVAGKFDIPRGGLIELDLAWNDIRGRGASDFFYSLTFSTSLRALDVSYNAVGSHLHTLPKDVPVQRLADVVRSCTSLTHLDISYNQLQERHAIMLSRALENNHTLIGLHCAGNHIVVDSRGFVHPRKPIRASGRLESAEEAKAVHKEDEAAADKAAIEAKAVSGKSTMERRGSAVDGGRRMSGVSVVSVVSPAQFKPSSADPFAAAASRATSAAGGRSKSPGVDEATTEGSQRHRRRRSSFAGKRRHSGAGLPGLDGVKHKTKHKGHLVHHKELEKRRNDVHRIVIDPHVADEDYMAHAELSHGHTRHRIITSLGPDAGVGAGPDGRMGVGGHGMGGGGRTADEQIGDAATFRADKCWICAKWRPFLFEYRAPLSGPKGHVVEVLTSFDDWQGDMMIPRPDGVFELGRMVPDGKFFFLFRVDGVLRASMTEQYERRHEVDPMIELHATSEMEAQRRARQRRPSLAKFVDKDGYLVPGAHFINFAESSVHERKRAEVLLDAAKNVKQGGIRVGGAPAAAGLVSKAAASLIGTKSAAAKGALVEEDAAALRAKAMEAKAKADKRLGSKGSFREAQSRGSTPTLPKLNLGGLSEMGMDFDDDADPEEARDFFAAERAVTAGSMHSGGSRPMTQGAKTRHFLGLALENQAKTEAAHDKAGGTQLGAGESGRDIKSLMDNANEERELYSNLMKRTESIRMQQAAERRAPTQKIIPRPQPYVADAVVKAWTFEDSVFGSYQRDTPALLHASAEADWERTKIGNFVRAGADKAGAKMEVKKHFKLIKNIFRRYAASFSTGNNIYELGWNGFTDFTDAFRLVDGRAVKLKDIDTIFIATNVTLPGEMDADEKKKNPQRLLTRYEFIEALVRLAKANYIHTRVCDTYTAAMQRVVEDHLIPYMDPELDDPEEWREERLYREDVDLVFKQYEEDLLAVYDANSGKSAKPGDSTVWVSINEWMAMVARAGLIDPDFTERDARLAFALSQETVEDEMTSDDHQKLSAVEFFEAVARVAEARDDEDVGLAQKLSPVFDALIATIDETDARDQVPNLGLSPKAGKPARAGAPKRKNSVSLAPRKGGARGGRR